MTDTWRFLKFEKETLDFAVNYNPKDDDLFVATYPKCGTTWTQQIVYLILSNGKPDDIKQMILNSTHGIEKEGKETQLKPLIKTHLSMDLMPFKENAKYLFIFRNPKDTVVSYYHYAKTIFKIETTIDFHQFFEDFINGKLIYGDYFKHVLGYWKHRNDKNVEYLFYEEMKRNPKQAVLKIAEFLGQEFANKLKDNNEFVLNEVLKYSSFDFMKTDANLTEYETKASDLNLIHQARLRKGIVGDWRSRLTKEESDLVDQRFKQEFAGTELEHIWADVMDWNPKFNDGI